MRSTRVIFIGGQSRSGSTLLARLLEDRMEGVVNLGEVTYVWDRGFDRNELCTCGLPFLECPFWSEVANCALGSRAGQKAAELRGLKRSIDRMRYVPRLLSQGGSSGYQRSLANYQAATRSFLEAAISVSGARVAVDASKDPPHGLILCSTPGLEVFSVHLVRDSRAVAFSLGRERIRPEVYWKPEIMPRNGRIRAALDWNANNALMHVVSRRSFAGARLRYEDLVADADATIVQLCSAVGLPQSRSLPSSRTSHAFSGNPMRFAAKIEVSVDDEWTRALSSMDRRTVTALTLPLLKLYGYPTNVAVLTGVPQSAR